MNIVHSWGCYLSFILLFFPIDLPNLWNWVDDIIEGVIFLLYNYFPLLTSSRDWVDGLLQPRVTQKVDTIMN
jgi:hypothetical protein